MEIEGGDCSDWPGHIKAGRSATFRLYTTRTAATTTTTVFRAQDEKINSLAR